MEFLLVDIPPGLFLLVDIPLVDFSPVDIPPVDILLVDIPPRFSLLVDIPPVEFSPVDIPQFLGINLLLWLKDSKIRIKCTISKIPFGTNSSNQQFLT